MIQIVISDGNSSIVPELLKGLFQVVVVLVAVYAAHIVTRKRERDTRKFELDKGAASSRQEALSEVVANILLAHRCAVDVAKHATGLRSAPAGERSLDRWSELCAEMDRALLGASAPAERYGLLPAELGFKDQHLTELITSWGYMMMGTAALPKDEDTFDRMKGYLRDLVHDCRLLDRVERMRVEALALNKPIAGLPARADFKILTSPVMELSARSEAGGL